jgi:hypothetical protein
MELVRNGNRIRRARTMFSDNDVGFAHPWVVAVECVGAVQQ